MLRSMVMLVSSLAGMTSAAGIVTDVTARQIQPWNGLVEIAVGLSCESNDLSALAFSFVASNSATKAAISVEHITRNGDDTGSGTSWTRKFIWDAKADVGEVKIDDIALTAVVELPFGGVQLWENGPYWAECNVGATKPEESGYYFWWGDTVGYKRNANDDGWVSVKDSSEFSFSHDNCPTRGMGNSWLQSAGYIDATGNLVAAHDAATVHLGAPWRMPTKAEFEALVSNCTTTWATCNNVNGRLITGKGIYSSKSIFLPATGNSDDSCLYNRGSRGCDWSSTPSSDNPGRACDLVFGVDDVNWDYDSRCDGQTVRPIRNFSSVSVAVGASSTHLTLDCAGVSLPNGGPYTEDVGGVTWTFLISDGKAEIRSTSFYTAAIPCTTAGAITIPSALGGCPVSRIGNYAFYECNGLTSITISASVKEIGEYAFAECGGLKSIIFPNGVESIYEGAFDGCENLMSITIPASLTFIEDDHFVGCYKLVNINVSPQNTRYFTQDGVLFYRDQWRTRLAFYPYCKQGSSYAIPSGVTVIGSRAFDGRKALTTVAFPEGVVSIYESAFSGCSAKNIDLPSSLTEIWDGAFYSCGASSLIIPAGVAMIRDQALNASFEWLDFEGAPPSEIEESGICCPIRYNGMYYAQWEAVCSECHLCGKPYAPYAFPVGGPYKEEVNGIVWTFMIDDDLNASVGSGTYGGVRAVPENTMGNVIIPSMLGGRKVTCVGSYAFAERSAMTSVTIPSSVETIQDSAFKDCSGLSAVSIPQSVTLIGDSAFHGCTSLGAVVLHEGLTEIGHSAFRNCSALCGVNIPKSVELVSGSVFAGTKYWEDQNNGVVVLDGCALGLKGDSPSHLVVPDGVRLIAGGAFEGCTATSLSLPSSLRHIGGSAFRVSSIGAVEIPCGVETIGGAAFINCSQLKSATIPECVRVIGDQAFRVCSNLETVQLSEGLECVGREAFYECKKLSGIALPDTVTSIGDRAFYGCSGLRSAEIGAGIRSIGQEAFEGCVELRSLALYGAPTNLGEWAFGGRGKDYRYLDAIKIKDLKTWCANEFGDNVLPLYFTKYNRSYSKLLLNDEQISELLEIPDGVSRIGASTFHYMPIKELKLPPSVESIGENAFSVCPYLANVQLSEGLKDIDDSAFYSCKAMGEVSIPASVERVGQDSFRDCNTLSNIFFIGDAPMAIAYGGRELEPDESLRIGTTPCKIIVLEGSKGWDEDGDGKWHGLEVIIRPIPSYVITYENLRDAANPNPIAYKATDEIVFANLNDREDARFVGWNPAKIEKGSTGDKTVVACWETKTVSDLLKGCGDVALSGAANWFAKWTGSEWALQSGVIADRQMSTLSCKVDGAGALTFKWKVSSDCAEGWQDDYLNFEVDGQEVAWIGGEKGWIEQRIELAASDKPHEVKWSYNKDKSDSAGDDCGWLKDVVWTPSVAEPIPELGSSADASAVQTALEGSADAKLAANIIDASTYGAYREWALKIGAAEVKASPFAWVSFATDSAALLAKMPTDEDLRIEEFKPSAMAGSFDFTVSVKDVSIGDNSNKDNLQKLFGLEGAETLESSAFSLKNVMLDFKEPQEGKLKFVATPAIDNAKSFFMKMKVK